jgi:hypothetical protein
MKRFLCLLITAITMYFVSCDKIPTQSTVVSKDEGNVPVNFKMKIDPAATNGGNECQVAKLKKLYLKLFTDGAETIYDTVPITKDFNNEEYIEILRSFYLKPFRLWTLEAFATDENDSITHSGTSRFPVEEYGDDNLIELSSNFFILQVSFYPLSRYSWHYGEIRRCEVVVDKDSVARKDDPYAIYDDTVKLNYNYVRVGKSHEITLNVYGTYFGDYMLLYSGSVTKEFNRWNDEKLSITLKWMGPDTIPPTFMIMDVILDPIIHHSVNGEIEIPPVQ